ncbi:hypothetical protein KSS87_004831 [Heliosperma pusillum]|nr:hypothetical protein KSS87_004831 [Heliosperma pusillum]
MVDAHDDSNALILPAVTKIKKNNNHKLKPQITISKDKKLSKSQQRKLRRLEEEKEKEKLLAKSLENLKKHTIKDGAHSFLRSSEKIGQRETMREKRRMEMLYSKAGLQVPESESRPKKNKVESCENESDSDDDPPFSVDEKNVNLQPIFIENISASSESSRGPTHENRTDNLCAIVSNDLAKDITSENDSQAMKIDVTSTSISTSADNVSNPIVAAGPLDDYKVDKVDGTKCVERNSLQVPPVPPTVIHVLRPKEVVNGRKDLPIIMMEQEIMEAINSHRSVIICGATGCGKTTQIPQFLYEAGYGSTKCSTRSGIIGVTQPRRVAVLSTAKRVAYELGVRLGKEVGFQVRHDKKIGENSSIKFMTDGILLRELQSDFLLKRYSVIILDEAHERSLNTDILIGMLSRIIEERQMTYEDQQQKLRAGVEIDPKIRIYPLKLILMSATLRVEDFTSGNRIFRETPPVIEIPTRQFPVTRHFSKRTELVDYIGEAYKTVLKIHKKLPPGGILVFVTGQREVEDLCCKLRQASRQFETRTIDTNKRHKTSETDMTEIDGHNIAEIDEALDDVTTQQMNRFSRYDEYHDDLDDHELYLSDNVEIESDDDSDFDFEVDENDQKMDDSVVELNLGSLQAAFEALAGKSVSTTKTNVEDANINVTKDCSRKSYGSTNEQFGEKKDHVGPLHVLPLYAMLPAAAQLRVFEEVKEGKRLVVVATNVAETSLTIPGIKYVVDTGREKVKLYNSSNGMESYEIQWISKASASQRAGRAGRTGPGHCYCLYSGAALTNEFPEFSCAEILKTPVDGVILLLKSMRIRVVTKFPFPTPPDATDLIEAEKCLKALEALDSDGNLTPLGKAMAQYPMGPRHSKLLLLAMQIIKKEISHERRNLVLGYAIAVAAALGLSNPFLSEFGASDNPEEQDENKAQKSKLTRRQIKENRAKLYNLKSDAITVAYTLLCFEQSEDALLFCNKYALSLKTMEEMSKLRKLILQLIFNQRYSGPEEVFSWTHGTIQNVEHSWTTPSSKNSLSNIEEDVICQAICSGWPDRVAKQIRGVKVGAEEDRKVNAVRYQALMVEETVFLRRWSTISRSAPDFLVYHEMQHVKRPYIHAATSVRAEWLVKYAGSLCTYSAPLADRNPVYDPRRDQVFCYVIPYFGPHSWELPPSKAPIKDIERRVAAFAYTLLDGHVLPCIKSERKSMSAPPSSILKPESSCQKRVHNLLCQLSTKSRIIDSCGKLCGLWNKNPWFLHSEIMAWFQEGFHHRFNELWAKMIHEASLEPKDRFRERTK